MEDSAESVSICCDLNVILLTSLIVLVHPPRSMSNCCTTKLIYAKMDSSQSRRLKLSVEERKMKRFIVKFKRGKIAQLFRVSRRKYCEYSMSAR